MSVSSSLLALEVIIMKTYGAASDNNVGIMITQFSVFSVYWNKKFHIIDLFIYTMGFP